MRKLVVTVAFLAPTLGVVSAATGAEGIAPPEPQVLMVAPFVLLLLSIALLPFIHKHFWERNYHYPRRRSSGDDFAVKRIMGSPRVRKSARNARQTDKPSITGIITSKSSTSGDCRWILRRTSSPSTAWSS